MSSVSSEAVEKNEKLSIGDVLRAWLKHRGANFPRIPLHHWKVLRALAACRTAAMGGHVYRCADCGHDHFVPHSCRNRHCSSCQAMLGYDWMEKQTDALLPIPYFHLVFTLPHELNPLIAQNQAALYKLLFDSASATLLEFGRNHFKAQIGVTAVLHTWSQTLGDHYHLHCIVTGGGLKLDGSGWAKCPKHWLFPVKALSKVFRAKYRDGLRELHEAGELEFHGQIKALRNSNRFGRLIAKACRQPWVVFAKRPFAGPKQVIGYLARYTHRVGITNSRIKSLDVTGATVTFGYKDYADRNKRKDMILSLDEFARRFRLHILPTRFVKVRHYGMLSNRSRTQKVAEARVALGVRNCALEEPPSQEPEISRAPRCPHCQSLHVRLIRVVIPPWRLAGIPP